MTRPSCWHCHVEPAAPVNHGLCLWCSGALDDLAQRDTACPNFEACVFCGSELRRGHCYECTSDNWAYGPAEKVNA